MGFASAWLKQRAIFPELIDGVPDEKTGIIVVIPSYDEPGIVRVLDSIAACSEPECKVEVIVVVNAPEKADPVSLENNRKTLENIESWKLNNSNCFFRLFSLNIDTKVSGWGVGLARKTGMDEAVRRFSSIGCADGVILNLDADCTVESNYLDSVCNGLFLKKGRTGCSIYFEHPISGTDFEGSILKSIVLYELHLRFYFQGLAYSGFPYVFHTVGSAFAVKALPYIKVGGMNRKQAGEDFYFIQKLVSSGGWFSLNSTTVYPSPRASSRVPFGTGASISKLTEGTIPALLTYNQAAFTELRQFFSMIEEFYSLTHLEFNECCKTFPGGIKMFLDKEEWLTKMDEIKNNTSGLQSFKKRFFEWFNMFRIVKYLNFVHQELYEKKDVKVSAAELLSKNGVTLQDADSITLLNYFRNLEKRAK